MSVVHWCWLASRLVATGAVGRNVGRALRRLPPVEPIGGSALDDVSISVVVPARDEAGRIGPLLAAVVGAPGVAEIVVVDDESSDATASVAAAAGARVVTGQPPPVGWAGKAWALQQGLDAATGEWIVFLDADTRPAAALPRSLVGRAVRDQLDVLTVAGRFDLEGRVLRWLHPALLTTLVYRSPPPGALDPGPVGRRIGNGQCIAARAATLRRAGGFGAVAHHTVEDVALVRALATAGFAVAFLDAGELLEVRMYASAREAWSGWGRSLAMPGVDGLLRRAAALAMLAATQVLPVGRLAARRSDALDVILLVMRTGTLAGTARAYRRRGLAYWLSPLADAAAVAAVARGTFGPPVAWRGRRPPQRRAIQNRRPTIDINAPVAAVRRGPSATSCTTG